MKNKSKSKYKFIVTAPDKFAPGGVSLFCRTLNKYMSSNFYFFYRKSNSFPIQKNLLHKIIGQLINGFSFISLLISNLRVKAVVINVSFSKVSLIRELYYTSICKLFQKPTVIFFHGWQKKDLDFFANKGTKFLKFILSNCKQIFVLSKEFKIDLLKIEIKNPIWVTTTMFDDSDLIKPSETDLSNKYYKTKINYTAIFLSRIEKEKGIYEAIEVIKWLNTSQKNYTFNLSVIGDGTEFKNVVKYNDDNIIFHGYKRGLDKFNIINNGDLLLFPTYHGEGFPIVITEAMACGLPIFTRPVGGVKDFFKSEMGFCSESLDPIVFGKAILDKIHKNKLEEAALFNLKYAWQNLAASKYAKDFENKINNLFI